MPVPFIVDGRLALISVALSMLAAYAALMVVERIRATHGSGAFGWLAAGAVTVGTGYWGMQYVGMTAYRLPYDITYVTPLTALSRILAIGVAATALGLAANLALPPRVRALCSAFTGIGISAVHAAGMAAVSVAGAHIRLQPWPALAAVPIAVAGMYLCLTIVVRLRDARSGALPLRLLGAAVLGGTIAAVHVAGMAALRVRADSLPAAAVRPLDIYVPAVVATVCTFLLAAVTAAALFDGRLRRERQNVSELRDLYARERRVAMTLQRALLPARLPSVDGVHFSSAYVPGTRDGDIGGDWFDAFVLDDGTVAVSIGDAAGRGLPAAIAMNVVRQALRSAADGVADPADVLRHANKLLLGSDSPSLVTAVFGVIDPLGLTFRYAVAGHPPLLLATDDGELITLPGTGTGLPLGVFDDYVTSGLETQLPPGSLLAFYTDGFIEYDRDLEAGFAALGSALVAQALNPAGNSAAAIDHAIFAAKERHDDAAIMTVSIAAALERIDAHFPAAAASAPRARTAIRRFLAARQISAERSFDVIVAVGEAVANAIEHAYSSDAAVPRFRLRARADGAGIEITVEDHGCWREPVTTFERGRGIALMTGLASECSVEPTGAGTRVVLRFALGVPEAAAIAAR